MQLWPKGFESSKSLLNRILSGLVIALVRFYQISFAYFLGGRCRFTPTCSEYCIDCFRKHRFYDAAKFSVSRLMKCHPLGGHGYDPAPEAK